MNCNEYVNRINDLLSDYVEAEKQIALLNQRRVEIKQQLAEAFQSSGDFLTAEVRNEVAYHWYWNTTIDTASIAIFLDMHPNHVGANVGPLPSGYFCKCGAEEMYASRTARQTIDSARKQSDFQCDDCRETKRSNSNLAWQEKQRLQREGVEDLKSMPYDQYLQTEHWQQVRNSALRRAGYRCQLCSATAQLQVHHNTYENRGEEQPQDVIALCKDCHKKHHGINDGASPRRRYKIPDEYSDIIIE